MEYGPGHLLVTHNNGHLRPIYFTPEYKPVHFKGDFSQEDMDNCNRLQYTDMETIIKNAWLGKLNRIFHYPNDQNKTCRKICSFL